MTAWRNHRSCTGRSLPHGAPMPPAGSLVRDPPTGSTLGVAAVDHGVETQTVPIGPRAAVLVDPTGADFPARTEATDHLDAPSAAVVPPRRALTRCVGGKAGRLLVVVKDAIDETDVERHGGLPSGRAGVG